MKTFKLILKILLGLVSFLILTILIFSGILFFKPDLIINPKNIAYVLNRFNVFESWSWSEARMDHRYLSYSKRHLEGHLKDFCFVYKKAYKEVDVCLDEISWNFDVGYEKGTGVTNKQFAPINIISSKTYIASGEDPEDDEPTDILGMWETLWKPFVPEIRMSLKDVRISSLDKPEEKPLDFSVELMKTKNWLTANSKGFVLTATPQRIVLDGPGRLKLPVKLPTKRPLHFSTLRLTADMNKEDNIPVRATAQISSARVDITTLIDKELLKDEMGNPEFINDILGKTRGTIIIDEVKATLAQIMKPPFDQLPAPLNAMEGPLTVTLKGAEKSDEASNVKIDTELNMQGGTQVLNFVLHGLVPLNLETKEVGGITIDLDLKKVALHLPQLSRTKLPPQLLPDSRIKNTMTILAENRKKAGKKSKESDVDVHLQALGKKALSFRTNLLDEILRMNLDIQFSEGEIKNGYVQILPLKTTFFKRPIKVHHFRLTFKENLEPIIKAQLLFDLPEYKITMDLEGPAGQPRQAFKSEPPLPLDDIYSVILFGRPLENLEDEDQNNAQSASQVLSKGFLSLAVLYYFAGSPVESIGYDPESQVVSAQVGLGSKSSLRVSSEDGGMNSAGVRRSLGNGWYIDSSIQRQSGRRPSSQAQDFGVMLERIISY